MSWVRSFIALFAIVAAGAALSACGGGGGSTMPGPSPSSSPPPCNTAQSAMKHVIGPDGKPMALRVALSSRELPQYDPRRIVVRFATSAYRADRAAKIASAIGGIGALPLGLTNRNGFQVFTLPSGGASDRAMAAIRALPGVRSVSRDAYRYALSVPNDPAMQNDYQQWDMFDVNLPSGWNLTTGNPAVTVAVVDTGVDLTNPDVSSKIVGQHVFVQGAPGGATVQDDDGHGTNVSGIAAADTNNALGVAGVGYNVNLLEARVFGHPTAACPNPSAFSSDIANAILWAIAAPQNAKVINLSLGSPTADPNEESAVAQALTSGVSVVAASGNDGTNTVDYPAADPGVIAVGATVLQDVTPNNPVGATEVVAGFSNYGPQLAVVAPGGGPTQAQVNACAQNIANCDYLQWIFNLYSNTAFGGGNSYALFAGTSQASPHVAGLVALMYSKALADGKSLTPAQARSLIISHAANISDPHQGNGRIDAAATLADPQL